jgi:hypothetical protein
MVLPVFEIIDLQVIAKLLFIGLFYDESSIWKHIKLREVG